MSNIKNNILEQKNERITSLFGAGRTITIQGTTINGHSGIDFVPEGWIIAPEDGEVIAVKDSVSDVSIGTGNDFGNYVHLRVNERFILRFCHLKQGAVVKVGQRLKKGARIGYMGTTGFSTGIHLHFEIRDNGVAIDPLPYLEGKIALNIVPTTPSAVPQPANTSCYVVVVGDIMTKIARKFGLSLNALTTANPQIKDINIIKVGQVINLPNIAPVQPPTNSAPVAKKTPNPTAKSLETLANEVIRGDWGNGIERIQRLTAAGYDAKVVQARVDEIFRI